MKRDTTIHLRIDVPTRDRLFAVAASSGCSLSSWMRGVATTAAIAGDTGIRLADEMALARRDVARIGNNLNQIARNVNTNGTVDDVDLNAALDEVRRIGRDITAILSGMRA